MNSQRVGNTDGRRGLISAGRVYILEARHTRFAVRMSVGCWNANVGSSLSSGRDYLRKNGNRNTIAVLGTPLICNTTAGLTIVHFCHVDCYGAGQVCHSGVQLDHGLAGGLVDSRLCSPATMGYTALRGWITEMCLVLRCYAWRRD